MPEVFTHDSFLISSGQKRKYKYITVSQDAENYFNILPVLDVQINQRTDLSITKTLSGTFNYVVFQDMPVSLSITGIYALGQPCKGTGNVTKATIQDLYTKYKIGNKSNSTLRVTLNGISYDVMAVSLQQRGSGIAEGIMAYVLSMIGVRRG